MPYDEAFWTAYERYLLEKKVRTNHDAVFDRWMRLAKLPLRVIDLGCGIGEFNRYGKYVNYVGVDVVDSGKVPDVVIEDYSDPTKFAIALAALNPQPTAFVSLFSIEACFPAEQRYQIYEAIFKVFPSIQYGLVSGFFYASKRDQLKVGETGGLESFQTIETPAQYPSEAFSQYWMSMFTPSKMFGPDVVGVWKLFTRQPPPVIPSFYDATSSHGNPALPK